MKLHEEPRLVVRLFDDGLTLCPLLRLIDFLLGVLILSFLLLLLFFFLLFLILEFEIASSRSVTELGGNKVVNLGREEIERRVGYRFEEAAKQPLPMLRSDFLIPKPI